MLGIVSPNGQISLNKEAIKNAYNGILQKRKNIQKGSVGIYGDENSDELVEYITSNPNIALKIFITIVGTMNGWNNKTVKETFFKLIKWNPHFFNEIDDDEFFTHIGVKRPPIKTSKVSIARKLNDDKALTKEEAHEIVFGEIKAPGMEESAGPRDKADELEVEEGISKTSTSKASLARRISFLKSSKPQKFDLDAMNLIEAGLKESEEVTEDEIVEDEEVEEGHAKTSNSNYKLFLLFVILSLAFLILFFPTSNSDNYSSVPGDVDTITNDVRDVDSNSKLESEVKVVPAKPKRKSKSNSENESEFKQRDLPNKIKKELISTTNLDFNGVVLQNSYIIEGDTIDVTLRGVKVENITTGSKTKTDRYGRFDIKVNLGDDLVFTKNRLESIEFKIFESTILYHIQKKNKFYITLSDKGSKLGKSFTKY